MTTQTASSVVDPAPEILARMAETKAAGRDVVATLKDALDSIKASLSSAGIDGSPVITIDMETYRKLSAEWQPEFRSTGRRHVEFAIDGVTFRAEPNP